MPRPARSRHHLRAIKSIMNLYSGIPFPSAGNFKVKNYNVLLTTQRSDIIILGAGITGAFLAYELCLKGFDVIVLDKSIPGLGSTAASTSLIQYELDVPLIDLKNRIGIKAAVDTYKICEEGVNEILLKGKKFPGWEICPSQSIQFASTPEHLPGLYSECKERKKYNLPAFWLNSSDLRLTTGMVADGALQSNLGAKLNAFQLTHHLFDETLKTNNLRIFQHALGHRVDFFKNGIEVILSDGKIVKGKKLILATGYEAHDFFKQDLGKLMVTFVSVTKSLPFLPPAFPDSTYWGTGFPYVYLRSLSNNRVMIGGGDDNFRGIQKRNADLMVKSKQNEQKLNQLFPGFNFEVEHQWAGNFMVTSDGLPFIGKIPSMPHCYVSLNYGGNGITFSQVAAQLIARHIAGKKVKSMDLFSINR